MAMPGAGPQKVLSRAFLCICAFEGPPGSAKGVLICVMCFELISSYLIDRLIDVRTVDR